MSHSDSYRVRTMIHPPSNEPPVRFERKDKPIERCVAG
jgi:hypothetical protein